MPRSNQNRKVASKSARTSGWSQLKSGCAESNRCRYHHPLGCPEASRIGSQALPPNAERQSLGGLAPSSAPRTQW